MVADRPTDRPTDWPAVPAPPQLLLTLMQRNRHRRRLRGPAVRLSLRLPVVGAKPVLSLLSLSSRRLSSPPISSPLSLPSRDVSRRRPVFFFFFFFFFFAGEGLFLPFLPSAGRGIVFLAHRVPSLHGRRYPTDAGTVDASRQGGMDLRRLWVWLGATIDCPSNPPPPPPPARSPSAGSHINQPKRNDASAKPSAAVASYPPPGGRGRDGRGGDDSVPANAAGSSVTTIDEKEEEEEEEDSSRPLGLLASPAPRASVAVASADVRTRTQMPAVASARLSSWRRCCASV